MGLYLKISGYSNFSAFQIFNRLLLLNFNVCLLVYVKFILMVIDCQVPALVKFLVMNIVRVRMSSLSSCQVSSGVKFLQLSNFFSIPQLPNFSSLPAFQLLQNLTGGRGARGVQ